MLKDKVQCAVEKMIIPTYVPPADEELPMYSEFRQHQGSTGYAYPNRITVGVERETVTDKEYTVVRIENDYIRLIILPEVGGRIWEGYDKTTDYYFMYHNSCIKPVIVGSYGSFIGAGMEFNWPFHHRPSTFMSVDYKIEQCEDGSAIVWLSESSPSPGQFRMRGTHGIKVRPNSSYFETIVVIDNRTPVKHPFLWWENCGVNVNDDYQLFFPQDVGFVHHHYDRHHITFPMAKGYYAVELYDVKEDISIQKNNRKGNSLFAGPSKYDYFGGYDPHTDCGTIHVADHHITPGKKMFLWGQEELGKSWNDNMIGEGCANYAELMAGSYTDDQPDFTYIAPYEVKRYSQYWYPIHKVKVPTYANLDAVVSLDRKASMVRLAVTTPVEDATLEVMGSNGSILKRQVTLNPSDCKEFPVELQEEKYRICLTTSDGTILVDYTEDMPEVLDIPEDNKGIPTPCQLESAQDIYTAGTHVVQYRDPSWKGREYYVEALKRQPDYVPALLEMAEDCYNRAMYQEGLTYIARAEQVLHRYNKNPYDGTCNYLKGLLQYRLGNVDEAYETFYKAAWSNNVISPAMTFLAAIDGQRGDYSSMRKHAQTAVAKESTHSICTSYEAIAQYHLGKQEEAVSLLEQIIQKDKLNQLARGLYTIYTKGTMDDFYAEVNSNQSQTCIDIVHNLLDAGCAKEALEMLVGLEKCNNLSTMGFYHLAYVYELLGQKEKAKNSRKKAMKNPYVEIFPYRLEEIDILMDAVKQDPKDSTAVYLLGCLYYDKNHYEDAVMCYMKAIELAPDFYIPYRNLAIAYFSKFNRKDEALRLLMKACKLKPGDDVLVKETNYVMAKIGIDGQQRLKFVLDNMPQKPSDNLTWDLADAYSNVFQFQKAIDTLMSHEFVAAECQETYLTEAYTFAQCAKGRLLMKEGKVEQALECFILAQKIPANFRAGWWDKQALYYAIILEAQAQKTLGKEEEAKQTAGKLLPFIHSGYSPYMGPEADYYVACAYQMVGEDIQAEVLMSKCIHEWELDVKDDRDRKPIVTSLYWSYVPDGVTEHKAEVIRALAYGRLFYGDQEGALKLFKESVKLNPDNLKAKFEIYLLEQ